MRYVSRIHNMDWSFLDSFGQCQSYFSNFLRVFKKMYEESFPLTRVKIRYRNRLPWLSDGLKASIKYKNKLYLISLKHPTLYNISKYKQYKNKLISLLKIEEKHFYQSQIVQNKNNLRKVWTIVKEVINKKRITRNSKQFVINDQVTMDPNVISNGFNNFFVNVGPTLASKIITDGISHRNFLTESLQTSFFLEPTTTNEIKAVISKLKDGAPGRDGILPKHLKCISESIAYPLSKIANLSFKQGVFPTELKIAIVSPLYKAKDPMFFNNYRPISLLSVFSKILERLMYNRLLKFIDKNNLFNEFQFGFRNNHSTFMVLIVLVENLVTALDNGNCAVGLFLDFQTALDTVDHCILLDKLSFYGVRGIAHDWFYSYLSNRSQSVNYNDHESDLKMMKCGVPQGSILGPLLFLICINDLPSVSKYFMPILFADDTNLFCTGPNLHDIVCQINQEIKIIYSWVKANKLSLNIDKTNFMLFTPKRFSRAMDALLIDGKRIMEVSETKFLGVIIDNKLNWKPHIRHVCTKVAKGIGIILKARKVFNHETLSTLYIIPLYIHTWIIVYMYGVEPTTRIWKISVYYKIRSFAL